MPNSPPGRGERLKKYIRMRLPQRLSVNIPAKDRKQFVAVEPNNTISAAYAARGSARALFEERKAA